MEENFDFCINEGLNLVSYPCENDIAINDALPSEIANNLLSIVGEGVAGVNNNGTWVGSLTEFEGTKGYWFIADEGFDFVYNAPNALTRSQAKILNNAVPAGFEYEQSTRQSIYFIENIEDAEIGDWVVAYNDEVIVGAREWIGEYTDIPAMGFDNKTITAGYCNDCYIVIFKLYMNNTVELLYMYYETVIPDWTDNTIQMLGSFNTVDIPEVISLLPSYPNPFNPSTPVSYTHLTLPTSDLV